MNAVHFLPSASFIQNLWHQDRTQNVTILWMMSLSSDKFDSLELAVPSCLRSVIAFFDRNRFFSFCDLPCVIYILHDAQKRKATRQNWTSFTTWDLSTCCPKFEALSCKNEAIERCIAQKRVQMHQKQDVWKTRCGSQLSERVISSPQQWLTINKISNHGPCETRRSINGWHRNQLMHLFFDAKTFWTTK